MAKLDILIVVFVLMNFSEGLKCWHCQNARDNAECIQTGYLKECSPNQEYCENEIRAIDGGKYFQITKRCKQEAECSINKMQNYTGREILQCALDEPHSACRCCCGFDNCNGPDLRCIHELPICANPDSLENGLTSCPRSLRVGVSCLYKCKPGFQVEGDARTTCELKTSGVGWSNPPLRCVATLCPSSAFQEPRSDAGNLTCSPGSSQLIDGGDGQTGWKFGTVCEITCNENFQAKNLIQKSDCAGNGEWAMQPLCCVECIPNLALDVVVFIDRTEEALWDDRLSFLGGFIDFITFQYELNLNISFIPFGKDVDYANSIDFMTIDDVDNLVTDLPGGLNFLKKRDEFKKMPSATGQASNSGKALNEASRKIFGFHNNRVPMVFLLTSKSPSDLSLARQASQELADKKIHLRILPIVGELSASAGASRTVLQSLVESPDFLVEGSEDKSQADDFYLRAADQLVSVTRRACNHRAQMLQPCLFA